MTESVAESSTATLATPGERYALNSDLARMCLPSEFKDSNRTLAWIDSICFLFLIIGLIGLRPVKILFKPLTEVIESTPVIFTPPEDQPQPEPELAKDEPPPDASQVETPQ